MGVSRFRECPTCKAKAGSPVLCESCLWNRWVIEKYEAQLSAYRTAQTKVYGIETRIKDGEEVREFS